MSRRNWVVGNGVIQTLGTGCGKESERERVSKGERVDAEREKETKMLRMK